ncbi:DUF2357 domain-containing protein [Pseudidiomarina sp. YC-516-91]|uniref:DUF2357 domain-containing protein n=1 Tax=Pseudidiomarina salilacus TaxID=3384452 RepID=UPI00398509AE
MTDVLRFSTPDLEMLIWTNSIDRQQRTLTSALQKRRSGTTSINDTYPLKFKPAQTLQQLEILEAVPSDFKSEKLFSTIQSSVPIFFENTNYLIEINFQNSISDAKINHKNNRINSNFRFVKASSKRAAHLAGALNTGNDIGWFTLPLEYEQSGKLKKLSISIEVLPIKLDLQRDLPVMYQAIDNEFPLWRFSLLNPTEQAVSQSAQRGYFPILWLANFKRLREKFEHGLRVIIQAPHARLQTFAMHKRADRLKGRISSRLEERVQEDLRYGLTDKRYRVEQKRLSVDTPENRFIKSIVKATHRRLLSIETKLRNAHEKGELQDLSESFLNEIRTWREPLITAERQSFLKDVGDVAALQRESLVLQQKTGYNLIYSVWQELKFYLDAFDSQTTVSMKSIAEIYEVWCFLELRRILVEDLGFVEVYKKKAVLKLNNGIEHSLTDGFAGSFEFKRVADGLVARLAHEPSIRTNGVNLRSYLVEQRPDIVLQVEFPNSKKHLIWVFDAKYRLKNKSTQVAWSADEVDEDDLVPDDAINQMHRYRDSIIRLTKSEYLQSESKSRPVVGAFALYPGYFEQSQRQNPYQESISEIGIGAFALLPSAPNSGLQNAWLSDFLKEQLSPSAVSSPENSHSLLEEEIHTREPTRIPLHGMQQVLYPDLVLTAALGSDSDRANNYYESFAAGTARHYHIPVRTFGLVFQQHIIAELRFLAIMASHLEYCSIHHVWPIRRVQKMKRCDIPFEKTGKISDSDELYYVFTLGFPLTLPSAISNTPSNSFRASLKLTTLELIEGATTMSELKTVYPEALA